MKTRQCVEEESAAEVGPPVGIEAKTGPYPAARSWSGGRRRVLGREVFETNTYHVMSRTCGGEVFFDDVEKEALRRLLWKKDARHSVLGPTRFSRAITST